MKTILWPNEFYNFLTVKKCVILNFKGFSLHFLNFELPIVRSETHYQKIDKQLMIKLFFSKNVK